MNQRTLKKWHRGQIMQESQYPLQEAIKELKNSPTVNIEGKSYTQVSTRINIFRKFFPDATIETLLINNDDRRAIMQAKISIDGKVIATGYAEEVRGDDNNSINSTSMVEVCETSAIGRALANFGLGGSEYASAFEVQNAIAQQNSSHSSPSQQNQQSKPQQTQTSKQSFSPHEFSSLYSLGLQIQEHGSELIIVGNKDAIFNARDSIKACSFRWSSQNKYWFRIRSVNSQEAA